MYAYYNSDRFLALLYLKVFQFVGNFQTQDYGLERDNAKKRLVAFFKNEVKKDKIKI